MAIHFETNRAPILIVEFVGSTIDADYGPYLRELARLLEQHSGNVLIYDARRASPPTAKQRSMQAEWMTTHDALVRRQNLGTAFVIDSVLMRGALTAILWLQPLATPHIVTGTLDDALRWANERLRGAKAA